jgi:hypothetical protein
MLYQQLIKKAKIIFTFYRNFLLLSLLITACCLVLFWQYGLSILSTIFWFKMTTLALIYYFINSNKQKEYYYYQNLGISKRFLWSVTLIFDLSLLIFFIILIKQFK